MIRFFVNICIIFLISIASMASAWMMPEFYVGRMLPRSAISRLKAGPFFEEEFEFECSEDDECEIDWEKMPQPAQEVQNTASPFECEDEEECEIDWDAMPEVQDEEMNAEEGAPTPRTSTVGVEKQDESWEKGRMKLEMNWQIDECETDEDYCEDFCPDCAGSGKMPCRFCHGTGMVRYGNDIRTCMMCKDGYEECSSCRGTGKIAPWVTTFLDGNKP